jgi:hypothetical protein
VKIADADDDQRTATPSREQFGITPANEAPDNLNASEVGRWPFGVRFDCDLSVGSSRCKSTDRERTRSRIVAKLADGIVTTPRAEADLVVTARSAMAASPT